MAQPSLQDHGGRVAKLNAVLHLALERSTSLPLELFLECFPPEIAKKHEALLAQLHEAMLQGLNASVIKEFELICNEVQLGAKLAQLDDLALQQPPYGDRGLRVPPPAGAPPVEQMRLRTHDTKLAEKARLQRLLLDLEADRERLKAEVLRKRARKGELVAEIAKFNKELDKCGPVAKQWRDADMLASTQ